MTTWLIHGINATNGGMDSVGRLTPLLAPPVNVASYGYVGPVTLPCKNGKALDKLLLRIKPGDALVAHSNGCLLAWGVAQKVELSAVICINPALRRDAEWPEDLPVLCLANRTDWVVSLGRLWGRLYRSDGIKLQGWGAAGRYGFDSGQPKVQNLFTDDKKWEFSTKGHSGVFKDDSIRYWAAWMRIWLDGKTAPRQKGRLT